MFDFDFGGVDLSGIWEAIAGAGSKAADFLSPAVSAVTSHPLETIGLGLQGFNTFAPMFQSQPDMNGLPPNLFQAQPQQIPGLRQNVLRGQMADLQSAGLSGASPDFMAAMAGLTPEELAQLMGPGGSQRGYGV